MNREAAALAEPFVGITTDGKAQPGLFHIRSTGVTTEPVKKAAGAFLAALTPEQQEILAKRGVLSPEEILICGY